MSTKTEPTSEDVTLEQAEALAVALASERVGSAQLALDARRRDLSDAILALRAKYEDAGKYEVTSLDVARGVLVRKAVAR